MRPPKCARVAIWGALLLTAMVASGPAHAQLDRADPLEVPAGPLPEPEDAVGLPFGERLQRAETGLRDRGFRELPVLAWAALEAAKDGTRPNFLQKAVRLAPRTPGVLYEAARQSGKRSGYSTAALSLLQSFPGVVWLLATLGVAGGLGVLLATLLAVSVGYGRTLALHGHALGHFTDSIDPPSWPGMLLGIGMLAMLPLFGLGPFVIMAVAGCLAALRLPTRGSLGVAISMAMLGLCVGPLLDGWAKISAVQGHRDLLLAAWRVDRGQPLPGDEARLELAAAQDQTDLLPRLALAALYSRRGDLARIEELLADVPSSASSGQRSLGYNALGSVQLARGNVKDAVEWFEDARGAEESAAVLFNLSQAYGRALRLEDHSALFVAARELDPDLIREQTQAGGNSIHTYLIQPAIPLRIFLSEALAPSAQADEIARRVRVWTLGRRAPTWTWLVLPALGLLGVAARRRGIGRCKRCGKVICEACSPGVETGTCVTCDRLRGPAGPSDPRLRRAQLDLDRARRRRVALGLFGAGIVLPGLASLLEGRVGLGCLKITAIGTALGMLLVPRAIPGPWEVGELSATLPTAIGYAMLVPLYAYGLWGSFRRVASRGLT